MKKLLLFACLFVMLCTPVISETERFPDEKIKNISVIELQPTEFYSFPEFKAKDLNDQKQISGLWSTLNQHNLDALTIKTLSSSSLGEGYQSSNICDGKAETAWVEGVKGNGIGEWIKIRLDAIRDSPSSTPFSVTEVGIIPGYGKSSKTWIENNRVKTATLVVYSPPPSNPQEYQWVGFRLKFQDKNEVQYFVLPDRTKAINLDPMTKEVWLRIDEVYKGTKYDDTCISEVILMGGCEP
jgi:hypothetical protein